MTAFFVTLEGCLQAETRNSVTKTTKSVLDTSEKLKIIARLLSPTINRWHWLTVQSIPFIRTLPHLGAPVSVSFTCIASVLFATAMAESAELCELRNYFYLGNLSSAWTEGETVRVEDGRAAIEKDVLMLRIRLARGEIDAVFSEVTDSSAPALQVVRLLAQLIKDPTTSDVAMAALTAWLDDESNVQSPCFATMCAITYAHLGDHDNALRAAARDEASLEARAVAVHTLLAMDRPDVAAKEVATMQSVDEDATLTQLASAWTKLATGGDGVQNAIYFFQDLLERHGSTHIILNGLAICALARGRPDDAERSLQEALSKDQACVPTLINAIATARHRNKPSELVARYLEQLSLVAPRNSWLVNYQAKEHEFDTLAAQLSAA